MLTDCDILPQSLHFVKITPLVIRSYFETLAVMIGLYCTQTVQFLGLMVNQ